MRVAALQYDPVYLRVEENLERVRDMIADLSVDLLVLPELFATGYFFRSESDLKEVAEEVPTGHTTAWLRALAEERNVSIVAGLPERRGIRIYNSAVLVRPDGSYAVYRKTHLYDNEKSLFQPGDAGFKVHPISTTYGETCNVGMMICFDWYYPEAARSLALAGADVVAHPANLVRKDCPRAMPIRALENHFYTVTADRVGRESAHGETLTFIGQSLICNPEGDVLAAANGVEESVVVADIDPVRARNRMITPHNDLLKDRRPHLYRTDMES